MSTVKEIMEAMPGRLNQQSAAGMDAVIQYDLTGSDAGKYYAVIANGSCEVIEGVNDSPNMTLTMDSNDFCDLIDGKLDGMSAFMGGKLKIGGDMGLAMKMQSLFSGG